LTRNPDALARALQRLSEDTTVVEGGDWASHLFVVNPSGDRTLRGSTPSAEQTRQAAQVWAASGSGSASATSPADYARLKQEVIATGMAAVRGDTAAGARMQSFLETMAKEHGVDAASVHIPNIADMLAAQRGDRAALARLRAVRQQDQAARPRHGQSGLQTHSFVSFHPPLNKRAKRLARMGAQLVAPERHS